LSRRRQQGVDVFQIKEGRTAFGDSYLESETGAMLKESLGKALAEGG
jgi:hypothetical protein